MPKEQNDTAIILLLLWCLRGAAVYRTVRKVGWPNKVPKLHSVQLLWGRGSRNAIILSHRSRHGLISTVDPFIGPNTPTGGR